MLHLRAVHDLARHRFQLRAHVLHAELPEVPLDDDVLPEGPQARDVDVERVRRPAALAPLLQRSKGLLDVLVPDVAEVLLADALEDPRRASLVSARGPFRSPAAPEGSDP